MEKETHTYKMRGLVGRRTRDPDNLDNILKGLFVRLTGGDPKEADEAFKVLRDLADRWKDITEYPIEAFPPNRGILGREYIELYKNRAACGRGDILATFFGPHLILVRIGNEEEGFPGVWITYEGYICPFTSVARIDFPLHTCHTLSQYIFNAMLLKKEDPMGRMLNRILQGELDRRGNNIYKEALSWDL